MECCARPAIAFVFFSSRFLDCKMVSGMDKSEPHPIVLVMHTQTDTDAEQQKCRSSIRFNHCACPILMFSRVFERCFWVYAIFNDKSTVSSCCTLLCVSECKCVHECAATVHTYGMCWQLRHFFFVQCSALELEYHHSFSFV